MKICIIYGTKRGSTEKMAKSMAGVISEKHEVCVKDAADMPDTSECELIVLGAPIYYEKPLPSVREFLKNNDLGGKKVALFIMCLADIFGKKGIEYTENRYVKSVSQGIKGDIIAIKVFKGWMLKEDRKTIENGKEWIKRVLAVVEKGGKIPGIEHSRKKD